MKLLTKLLKAYLTCWQPHRGKSLTETVTYFYVPTLDGAFWVRLITLVIAGYLVFGFILIPELIDGASMEPTYPRKGFNFCWRGKYLFSRPRHGDVVIIRFTDGVSILKRIIGLPGDELYIKHGILYLNGKIKEEPYLRKPCDWNLPLRRVSPGHVYVIGDNRSMSMERHMFGEVSEKRINGAPLW